MWFMDWNIIIYDHFYVIDYLLYSSYYNSRKFSYPEKQASFTIIFYNQIIWISQKIWCVYSL